MSSELNSFYESTAFRRLAPAKAKLIREMVDMMENIIKDKETLCEFKSCNYNKDYIKR